MKTIEKDPNAVLDYWVDWRDWLGDDDTITQSSWLIPTGMKKINDTHTTKTAMVWAAGGRLGEEHVITNRIKTANGRTDERSIRLSIVQR